jgi:hypothetical protein
MSPALYVYALLEGRPRVLTVRGRRIEIVDVAGMLVALERRSRPPAVSERALRMQHEVVMHLARRADAILPVRFGTFVAADDLQAALRSRRRVLRTSLARVRGRAQISVRFFGAPAGTGVSPARSLTGAGFLRARASAARPVLFPAARAVRRAVKPMVSGERLDGPRGGIVLSMHHLVDRARVKEYRARLRASAEGLQDEMEIKVSGPFPPFAFAPQGLP